MGNQPGFVVTLWRESWSCDRYGNRWIEISSSLSTNRFLAAKKILESAKLFEFKSEKLSSDGRKISRWLVRNLHGCRGASFWRNPNGEESNPNGEKSNPNGLDISPQTHTQQSSCNPSLMISITSSINNSLDQDQEKEINNLDHQVENKYIKPDLDKARVTEKTENVNRDVQQNLDKKEKEETIQEKLARIQKLYAEGKAYEYLGRNPNDYKHLMR